MQKKNRLEIDHFEFKSKMKCFVQIMIHFGDFWEMRSRTVAGF